MDSSLADRLLAKRSIDPQTGCWEWTGACDARTGVGRMSYENRSLKVPRLALHAWRDFDLSSELFVLRSCANPSCFNPDHLVVSDRKTWTEHTQAQGRYFKHRGEENDNAKLTAEQVMEIRTRYSEGSVTQVQLAAEFGISQHHVSDILSGKVWQHAA